MRSMAYPGYKLWEGAKFFGLISNARAKGTRNTGGLERYFTYFCKTLYCTCQYNSKKHDVFVFVIKRLKLTWPPYLNFEIGHDCCYMRSKSSSNVLSAINHRHFVTGVRILDREDYKYNFYW